MLNFDNLMHSNNKLFTMKKSIIYIFIISCSISFAQKKANGKIYIEHPAIEIVNQFNEAFVKGDLDKKLFIFDYLIRYHYFLIYFEIYRIL